MEGAPNAVGSPRLSICSPIEAFVEGWDLPCSGSRLCGSPSAAQLKREQGAHLVARIGPLCDSPSAAQLKRVSGENGRVARVESLRLSIRSPIEASNQRRAGRRG